jgi:hypothetical protein
VRDVPLATFKDLSIDALNASRLGPFWAEALGLTWDPNPPDVGRLVGPTPGHMIWFAEVPQPKSVKHRVHLDIYAQSLADLEAIGATVVEPQREGWRWTIMADPEGGEFCAFIREKLPADRLHGLVVDSAEPAALAQWWAEIYDADITHHPGGWSTVEHVPGMPILTFDFVPVPEPKTGKNRVHWDVVTRDVGALVARGATVLRRPDDQIGWTVLADPEGNEFCGFDPPEGPG